MSQLLPRFPPMTEYNQHVIHHSTPQRSERSQVIISQKDLFKQAMKNSVLSNISLITSLSHSPVFHYCLHFILFTFVIHNSILHRHRAIFAIHLPSFNCLWINIELAGISMGTEYQLLLTVDSYVFIQHLLFKELKVL